MKFRSLTRADGPAMHALVAACPPLDLNSLYLYLLLTEHFADTCVLAEDARGLRGMVSAYQPPDRAGVLFVWQVAVHPEARGHSLGLQMLQALLRRVAVGGVRWIETTVSPGNQASRRLFSRLADRLGTTVEESDLFDAPLFGAGGHEAEPLLRIGPFRLP